ncbi:MAG: response regulator transcription factor [Chloroflexi bacterium]|nr:response regulator transcription factor [Chloroflexota bacterium]
MREGLRLILEAQRDFQVVAEATNGEEVVEKAREMAPDVILMDVTMPKRNGIEATRLILQEHPTIQVLALTVHDNYDYLYQALEAGASGYILKGATSEELALAVKAVHGGGIYLSPKMAKWVVNEFLDRAGRGGGRKGSGDLSPREREVLKLIAVGRTNKEIANLLHLSPSTVQTHRARVMEKLGLHTRSELVHYALRRGIVSASDGV